MHALSFILVATNRAGRQVRCRLGRSSAVAKFDRKCYPFGEKEFRHKKRSVERTKAGSINRAQERGRPDWGRQGDENIELGTSQRTRQTNNSADITVGYHNRLKRGDLGMSCYGGK